MYKRKKKLHMNKYVSVMWATGVISIGIKHNVCKKNCKRVRAVIIIKINKTMRSSYFLLMN